MANLTDDQVKHVASLAKLKLTDQEIAKYKNQLSHILGHFNELALINTDDVEPTSQTTGLTNVFRDDVIVTARILPIDQVFLNAKNKLKNAFVVDAVIDKDAS